MKTAACLTLAILAGSALAKPDRNPAPSFAVSLERADRIELGKTHKQLLELMGPPATVISWDLETIQLIDAYRPPLKWRNTVRGAVPARKTATTLVWSTETETITVLVVDGRVALVSHRDLILADMDPALYDLICYLGRLAYERLPEPRRKTGG